MPIAATPTPPYYAVIFNSPIWGGQGLTLSYQRSPEDIRAWKEHPEHRLAQARARDLHAGSRGRICRVEREYGFQA